MLQNGARRYGGSLCMTSIDSLVNISNTTISNSQVQRGVGIFVNSNGAVNLNNPITQNTATVRSRGIEVYVISSHDAANAADITQVLG